MEWDASTATWLKAVDRVFSNKYTVTDSLLGRKYYFRVLAQNAAVTPTVPAWLVNKDRSESGDLWVQIFDPCWRG